MIQISVRGLRRAFPIITDEHYHSTRLEYWLDEAKKHVGLSLWRSYYERGVYAYATHHLITEKVMMETNEDGFGGIDANRGPVSSESESVGGVSSSVSYGGAASNSADASKTDGDMTCTKPGLEYLRLAQLVGVRKAVLYVE